MAEWRGSKYEGLFADLRHCRRSGRSVTISLEQPQAFASLEQPRASAFQHAAHCSAPSRREGNRVKSGCDTLRVEHGAVWTFGQTECRR